MEIEQTRTSPDNQTIKNQARLPAHVDPARRGGGGGGGDGGGELWQ